MATATSSCSEISRPSVPKMVSKAADDTNSLVGGFAVGEFGDGLVKEVAVATPTGSYQVPDQVVILDMTQGREIRRSELDAEASVEGITALAAIQLDGDPELEICTGSSYGNGSVTCVDGLNFAEEWSGGTYGYVHSLQTAELDADPSPELLVANYGPAIEAREGESGWLKWRTPALATNLEQMSQVLAIDVDGVFGQARHGLRQHLEDRLNFGCPPCRRATGRR